MPIKLLIGHRTYDVAIPSDGSTIEHDAGLNDIGVTGDKIVIMRSGTWINVDYKDVNGGTFGTGFAFSGSEQEEISLRVGPQPDDPDGGILDFSKDYINELRLQLVELHIHDGIDPKTHFNLIAMLNSKDLSSQKLAQQSIKQLTENFKETLV